ncbi:hypothetical protein AKO1_013118 [Acrasis kona]|uniref:GH18 domain-containing protein n=1 Tax=Acrasis kona TaxID=1008807 RepID=A0AAW2ZG10_9EUKA
MNKGLLLVLLGLVTLSHAVPLFIGNKNIATYLPSWIDNYALNRTVSPPLINILINIPTYISVVSLSFIKPETNYSGNGDLSNTGFKFPSSITAVSIKNSIVALKRRSPNVKVLISIGGGSYGFVRSTATNFWPYANFTAINLLLRDTGADGLDLDYEPFHDALDIRNCDRSVVNGVCATDADLISLIKNARGNLTSDKYLTAAAWNTGAFNSDKYPASQFRAGRNVGMWVNPLRQAGYMIDALFIMSYDVNLATYNWTAAMNGFKYLSPTSSVLLGAENGETDINSTLSFASYSASNNGSGMFTWAYLQYDNNNPSNMQLMDAIYSLYNPVASTPTSTVTSTPIPTPTFTDTPTLTPTPTDTPSPTPSATPIPTLTPTSTSFATRTFTSAPTPTSTPTLTPTMIQATTMLPTSSSSPTPSVTSIYTKTNDATPTVTSVSTIRTTPNVTAITTVNVKSGSSKTTSSLLIFCLAIVLFV